MNENRNLDTIHDIASERQRLENIIAIKKDELRKAVEDLKRFDQQTQTLNAWSSLV